MLINSNFFQLLMFNFIVCSFHGTLHKRKHFIQGLSPIRTIRKRTFSSIKYRDEHHQSNYAEENEKQYEAKRCLTKVFTMSNKMDFSSALQRVIGVDEVITRETLSNDHIDSTEKASNDCVHTGIIDKFTEKFPFTSSGNQWFGVVDNSFIDKASTKKLIAGSLRREEKYYGKTANVLRGKILPEPSNLKTKENEHEDFPTNFIQMSTNLANKLPAFNSVDASIYKGIVMNLFYEGNRDQEEFLVSLRTSACKSLASSYKASFDIMKGKWIKVHISWKDFIGYGSELSMTPFDCSALKRISVIAEGEKSDFILAVSGIGFY